MLAARRGEVWPVDLGMTAKSRPAIILSAAFRDEERALYTIAPHTTALRGGRFEVGVGLSWLAPGAFDVQGLRSIPASVFIRKLGTLAENEVHQIANQAGIWLGIIRGQ